MIGTVLEIKSQLKWPVKFLLKRYRNPLTNSCTLLGLFFDLTKVYGVINHEILINKLEYYGVIGITKAWIESYLFYRSQFVEIFKTDNTRRNQKI